MSSSSGCEEVSRIKELQNSGISDGIVFYRSRVDGITRRKNISFFNYIGKEVSVGRYVCNYRRKI